MPWVLALWLALGGDARVTIAFVPPLSRAPARLYFCVRVEPKPDNRLLRVQTTSGDYDRVTDVGLAGEAAPRSIWIDWRAVPAGEYLLTATVFTSAHRVAGRALQPFVVTE